jgi:hypothetical protein
MSRIARRLTSVLWGTPFFNRSALEHRLFVQRDYCGPILPETRNLHPSHGGRSSLVAGCFFRESNYSARP